MTDNMRGAVLMIVSMVCFAYNDALIKLPGGVLPVFQTLSVCGAVVVVLLGILVLRSGWKSRLLNRRDKIILGIRALFEIGATFCIVNALFNIELANTTAILQILPLNIPLTAFVFLGETLGW